MSRRCVPQRIASLLAHAPAPLAVGDWTFPYRRPRGTKAARIDRVEGETLHLSDGSSMHRSHGARVAEGSVAP